MDYMVYNRFGDSVSGPMSEEYALEKAREMNIEDPEEGPFYASVSSIPPQLDP